MVNQGITLTTEDIGAICGQAADDRDFIQRTFEGLYFTGEDRRFLDSAWSHVDRMTGPKRAMAISALVLAAARKQPRGVFTVTGLRYDDGRRDLRLPLREHFRERAAGYNRVVFDSGQPCAALTGDVFDRRLGDLRRGVPRPAVCADERRQLLYQALPLPRGPEHVLARPADHAADPDEEAGQAVHTILLRPDHHRRAAPHPGAVQRVRSSCCPTPQTPSRTWPPSRTCCTRSRTTFKYVRSSTPTRSARTPPRAAARLRNSCSSPGDGQPFPAQRPLTATLVLCESVGAGRWPEVAMPPLDRRKAHMLARIGAIEGLPGRYVRASDVPASESGDAWAATGGSAFNAAAN